MLIPDQGDTSYEGSRPSGNHGEGADEGMLEHFVMRLEEHHNCQNS